MDENTEAALTRFQRRSANADRMYMQAQGLREQADAIDKELNKPDHERGVGDESTLALEAKLLRERADALTKDADGIQERLHQPPPDLTREIEEWNARMQDRDRGRDER